jgi:hypothetical protein
MKKIKQNWQTNLVALLILLCIAGAMLAVLIGKATLEEAGSFIVIVEPVLSAIGFIVSRDAQERSAENE